MYTTTKLWPEQFMHCKNYIQMKWMKLIKDDYVSFTKLKKEVNNGG